MKNAAAVIVISAACLAGCWQAAGIDLRDLPVRDGSEEVEESEADAAEGDDDIQDVDLFDPVPDPELDDIFVDDPTVDEVPPGMSAMDYCKGLQEAWCQYILSCCSGQDLSAVLLLINCDDPTASQYVAECTDRISAPIAAGNIVIDEAGFYDSCQPRLALSAGDCPGIGFFTQMFSELFETYCGDVIDGRVTEGGDCSSRLECEEGLCCSSGICTDCAGDGMECTANDQCGAGLRCIGHACVSPGGPSDSCDAEDEIVLSDCMAGTWCELDRCTPLMEAGQPCFPDNAVDQCKGACNPGGLCAEFCSVGPD